MIADYFLHCFGGRPVAERTLASTSRRRYNRTLRELTGSSS
jgi:hypothetical protein